MKPTKNFSITMPTKLIEDADRLALELSGRFFRRVTRGEVISAMYAKARGLNTADYITENIPNYDE